MRNMKNMLDIACEARDIPQDAPALMERVARSVCRLEGVSGVGAFVRIVDDEEIHRVNREQRGVDRDEPEPAPEPRLERAGGRDGGNIM